MWVVVSVLSLTLAAALLTASPPQAEPLPQDEPTELDEIVVVGERTRRAAENFVRSVTTPVAGRKAATWQGSVCVGVVGMQPEAARFMADRVSDWAHSLGLGVQRPGCRPNILITATDDGDATAREMVAEHRREFRLGVGGTDLGGAALRAFQSSGRLIRWWHVSLPVNDDTGRPVVRLPGQEPIELPEWASNPHQFGPYSRTVLGSRLRDTTRDDMVQVLIVIDVAALDRASFAQVTDYVAMVALAQIDPDMTPAYPSILNLFADDGMQQDTLTRWDRAYLDALYSAPQMSASTSVNLTSIATSMAIALSRDGGEVE